MNIIRLLPLILLAAPAAVPAESETPKDLDELAQQVRAAETAFAKTMAERDQESFIAHVADEALFFTKQGVLRGKTAVMEGWKPFFADSTPPFSWKPERVEVLDSGTLALSSGPVLNPEGGRSARSTRFGVARPAGAGRSCSIRAVRPATVRPSREQAPNYFELTPAASSRIDLRES